MKQLFVLLISATGLLAADATGIWEGTLKAPDHDGPAYLILTQQGETLSGSGGPAADQQHPISHGKAINGVITFDVEEDDRVMRFSLKQEGDEIKGSVTRERDGEKLSAELSVKRVKTSVPAPLPQPLAQPAPLGQEDLTQIAASGASDVRGYFVVFEDAVFASEDKVNH